MFPGKRGPGGVRVVQVEGQERRAEVSGRSGARRDRATTAQSGLVREMLDKGPAGDAERADDQGTVLGHGWKPS